MNDPASSPNLVVTLGDDAARQLAGRDALRSGTSFCTGRVMRAT